MAVKVMESQKVAATVAGGAIAAPAVNALELINPLLTAVASLVGILLAVVLIIKHWADKRRIDSETRLNEIRADHENDEHDTRVLDRKGKRARTPA